MENLNKLKILIVGLTTVLALSNFKNRNVRKDVVSFHCSNVSGVVYQKDFIHITNGFNS